MTGQLTLPLDAPADLAERLRRCGLPAAVEVLLHANRRVMISMPSPGALRVHRGYAFAPDDVVEALARWASPRRITRRERQALVRRFLGFPVHDFVPPDQPRRRRREPSGPGDPARLVRLQVLHKDLNDRCFGGGLAGIDIWISGKMRRKLGHYEPASEGGPAIAISRSHIVRHGWAAATDTLLHEMVHQWQDQEGLPVDHGPAFRTKARAVGIVPRARAAISA